MKWENFVYTFANKPFVEENLKEKKYVHVNKQFDLNSRS